MQQISRVDTVARAPHPHRRASARHASAFRSAGAGLCTDRLCILRTDAPRARRPRATARPGAQPETLFMAPSRSAFDLSATAPATPCGEGRGAVGTRGSRKSSSKRNRSLQHVRQQEKRGAAAAAGGRAGGWAAALRRLACCWPISRSLAPRRWLAGGSLRARCWWAAAGRLCAAAGPSEGCLVGHEGAVMGACAGAGAGGAGAALAAGLRRDAGPLVAARWLISGSLAARC